MSQAAIIPVQQQKHRRRSDRLLLCLGVCIALFTFPYLAYNASLMRICSASCTLRRLLGTMKSEDPQLRWADCRNDSATLLRAFGLHRRGSLQLSGPTYVWLERPVDAFAAFPGPCADAVTMRSKRPPAESSPSTATTDACFNQTFSLDDNLQVYRVLHRLQQNFTQRGLEMFMSDGSLLGSLRHFGFIPWDDDIDFLMLRAQKFEVRELLVQLSSLEEFNFMDTESVNYHWRLEFLCKADRTKPPVPRYGLSRLFPRKDCKIAADFFFGEVLGDHYLRPEMPYVYNVRDVYPLRLLPFGPHLMRAPANPRALTAAEYGKDYEFSCMFEPHSGHFPCREKFLECDRLRRVYPFVSHVVLSHGGRTLSADILVWKSQVLAIFIPPQRPA